MIGAYVRHSRLGHIVHVSVWPAKGDCFAGVVTDTDYAEGIDVGTYSTAWMKTAFVKTTRTDTPASAPDTIESMQHELDVLRIALGVDAEPLDTLPQRMAATAQSYRKLYDAVKEWESEQ